MKKLLSAIFVLGLLSLSCPVMSQTEQEDGRGDMPEYRGMFMNMPGITDSQKEELRKMQLAHQKQMRQIKSTMEEHRAHLNSLRIADKPDIGEINKTIDEITGTQAKMMKAREAHRLEMRSKLTDDQKAWFDSRPHKEGFGQGRMRGMKGDCQCGMRGRGPCWDNDKSDDVGSNRNMNGKDVRPRRFNN